MLVQYQPYERRRPTTEMDSVHPTARSIRQLDYIITLQMPSRYPPEFTDGGNLSNTIYGTSTDKSVGQKETRKCGRHSHFSNLGISLKKE